MNLNTEKRLCVCVCVCARVCVCETGQFRGFCFVFLSQTFIYLTLIFYMCIYKRSTSHISQHLTICR